MSCVKEHPLLGLTSTCRFAVWAPVTLRGAGIRVLNSPSVQHKAELTHLFVQGWKTGVISQVDDDDSNSTREVLPDRPVRSNVDNNNSQWCNKKTSILNTIHGIAHAESYAIELFWDAIARFTHYKLPISFYDDMVTIAGQEASHFLAWKIRLDELECEYGSLPTHDGLWRDAERTSHSLLARLAVINMLHEARGLDVFPLTKKKFHNHRDEESVRILENNFAEEIFHVATGLKWFTFLCSNKDEYDSAQECECNDECKTCIERFHIIVRKFHTGALKFETLNLDARAEAGMTREWIDYLFS